ncbi:ATP-binding protein [uncultured Psychroserpens sp.]|uniref:tetratricopeptide repeat-containing sensor histidine kinase n=1 Tax=uncultured Psychroserpens sp. TaxID=255436 RepID=UPI00262FC269|nr:ATP-binding protein [uncultured Psychroserpens sp.]
MKSNQSRFGRFLAVIGVSLLVINIPKCYSQEKLFSSEFKTEIRKACNSCNSKDEDVFMQLNKDKFHNAHVYFSRGQIDSSYVLIARIKEKKQIKDSSKHYIMLTLKSIVLDEKKLYNDAVKSLTEAITIGNKKQYSSVGNLYAILGQVYLEQREFKLGAEWLEKWKARSKVNSEKQNVNIHNLGLCYLHMGDYENAERNLLLGFQLNEKLKDTLGLARSSLDIANLYYTQYKDDQAIPFFEKGLEYAKQANDLNILQNAYLNLAVVNENAKDYVKAIHYRKLYEKIHDSIWNRDKVWQLAKKEKEVALAASNEILKSETLKKNLYSIIGFSLLLTLIIGTYFSYKTLKQKQLITHLNNTKDKLFSILTHDLKTPIHHIKHKLFQILSDSNLQSNSQNSNWQLITESYSLSKKTSLLMDNTLHWVLENKDQLLFTPKKIELNAIVDQVLYDYLPIIEEKHIVLNKEIETPNFAYADLNSVKVIYRNLLDNAIKFTPEKGEIQLKSYTDGDYIVLEIKDTGKGFNIEIQRSNNNILRQSTPDTYGNTGTGLGLALCNELALKNKGKLIIESKIGKGTKVALKLLIHKQ